MNPIKQAILNDPSASYWLKDAICKLDKRDPVDVLNELEVLTKYFQHKNDGLLAQPITEAELIKQTGRF